MTDGVNDDVVKSIANGCPLLEILCLQMPSCHGDGIRGHFISKMHNLKRLTLTLWYGSEDEDYKSVLRNDEVASCTVLAKDLIYIFSKKNLSKLQYLSLADCDHMNDDVLKTIAMNCPQLKNVHLQKSNNVSDAAIEFLREKCPNLTKLEFYVPT